MNILHWFRKPAPKTTEEYLALEGKKRTDLIVMGITDALLKKMDAAGMKGLTVEERTVLAAEALENEVNNNGYDGFFTNSSKEFAPIILQSLKRIGAAKAEKLTAKALECLKINGPLTAGKIDQVMSKRRDKLIDELGRIDRKYYNQEIDLAPRVLEYIKAHRQKITLE